MLKEECLECILLTSLELEAGSHGVTAAFDQQSLVHGSSDHCAKIDRSDRPRRPSCRSVSLKRCNEGRTTEALGDAAARRRSG